LIKIYILVLDAERRKDTWEKEKGGKTKMGGVHSLWTHRGGGRKEGESFVLPMGQEKKGGGAFATSPGKGKKGGGGGKEGEKKRGGGGKGKKNTLCSAFVASRDGGKEKKEKKKNCPLFPLWPGSKGGKENIRKKKGE